MWCQLCRKGVSLRQYMGKSFNFFVVWGRTWYHSAVVLFPSRGCSRGRCRSDAALSGRCPVLEELPCPIPVPVPIPSLPGRCAGLQGPQGSQTLPKGQGVLRPRAALHCPLQRTAEQQSPGGLCVHCEPSAGGLGGAGWFLLAPRILNSHSVRNWEVFPNEAGIL